MSKHENNDQLSIGEPLTVDNYVVHTTQEIDALGRATANGKTFNYYECNEQGGTVTFSQKALSHSVQLMLEEEERSAGQGISLLETMVRAQDSDAVLAQLYILSVLAPPTPLPSNAAPFARVELDDVIAKIGWDARSTEQRREMRGRVWEFIKYGARAKIVGERSVPYKDRASRETIPTSIFDSAWTIRKPQMPEQQTLGFSPDVPVSIELVLSSALTALITSPITAQYLPLGEALGAIPGNKPSGAWARVLGLSLASFWRRCPREALSGEIKPTRRELLDHFPPKIAPYQELFDGKDPQHAIKFWCGALALLVESGYLTAEGESTRSESEIRSLLPRKNWQRQWLDERVHLMPGAEMRAHIEGRINALPLPKPKKKMGRPRKSR